METRKRARVDVHSVEVSPGVHATAGELPASGGKNEWFFARGLIPRERVLEARAIAHEALLHAGDITDADTALPARGEIAGLLERQDVALRMRDVLEAPELHAFVRESFGEALVGVVPHKWLRAVGPGLQTGWHVDRTYLESVLGQAKVVSCWIPLGTVTPANGGLVICESDGDWVRERCRERRLQEDGTRSGWIELSEEELSRTRLFTTVYEPGDVVLFGADVVHCTAINTMPTLRLSCDVRFVIG
jgi:hypothetical protein